jgi:phage FluMu protein gp41
MAKEMRLVDCRRRVVSISGELPSDSVGHVDVEVDMGDLLPKGDKLREVFDSDAAKNVQLESPEVVVQSHLNQGILLLRQFIYFRGHVFGPNSIEPRRLPKLGSQAIANLDLGSCGKNIPVVVITRGPQANPWLVRVEPLGL